MAPFSAMLSSGPISSSPSPSPSSFGMVLAFFLSLALCSFLVECEHVLRDSTCEGHEPLCRNIQIVGRFVISGLAVDRAHMAAQEPRVRMPYFCAAHVARLRAAKSKVTNSCRPSLVFLLDGSPSKSVVLVRDFDDQTMRYMGRI